MCRQQVSPQGEPVPLSCSHSKRPKTSAYLPKSPYVECHRTCGVTLSIISPSSLQNESVNSPWETSARIVPCTVTLRWLSCRNVLASASFALRTPIGRQCLRTQYLCQFEEGYRFLFSGSKIRKPSTVTVSPTWLFVCRYSPFEVEADVLVQARVAETRAKKLTVFPTEISGFEWCITEFPFDNRSIHRQLPT
jgi:hypothetical protein